MILSGIAKEGFVVSCLSFTAMVKRAKVAGAQYVLGRQINQDPLEAHFAHQRQRGLRFDAPTVLGFMIEARNLDMLKKSNLQRSNVQLDL